MYFQRRGAESVAEMSGALRSRRRSSVPGAGLRDRQAHAC